jgi:hypothetical protein
MALAREMMTGGVSAGAARAINGYVNAAVAGAGTTIADATALKAGHNVVTTVAAGSGVLLENSEIGDEVVIYNATGSNALTIYPPTSSATINQLGAGVGMLLSPYTGVRLKKQTATAWTAWLSA